jgi:hypothetical protein
MLTQKLLAPPPHCSCTTIPRSVYVIGLWQRCHAGLRAASSNRARHSSGNFARGGRGDRRRSRRKTIRRYAIPARALIVGDGRSHFDAPRDKYDVIISEPSNPWMAGVSTLFTREFFLAAKSRLEQAASSASGRTRITSATRISGRLSRRSSPHFRGQRLAQSAKATLLLIGAVAPLRALEVGVMRGWQRPGVRRTWPCRRARIRSAC